MQDEPVTELALANELLAACIGRLSLRSLPCVASVSHRWRDAARAAFAEMAPGYPTFAKLEQDQFIAAVSKKLKAY